MFHVDADNSNVQSASATEFAKPHNAVVQKADLSAATTSGQLRQLAMEGSDPVEAAQAITAVSKEDALPIADTFVRSSLRGIAIGLDDAKLRERFLNRDLSTKELLALLNYASPEQVISFTRSLYTLSVANPDVRQFVDGKLDNAAHYMNIDEKAALIDSLLNETLKKDAAAFMLIIAQSSENHAELVQLLSRVGYEKLLATGNEEMKELVAQAVLGTNVRGVSFPEKLARGVDLQFTEAALDRIGDSFRDIIAICKSDPLFSQSKVAKDFIETAESNLADLALERAEQVVAVPRAPWRPSEPVAPYAPEVPTIIKEYADQASSDLTDKQAEEVRVAEESYQADLKHYKRHFDLYQEYELKQYQRELVDYDKAVTEHQQAMERFNLALKESWENLRHIANVYVGLTDLEFKYGVNITYGTSEMGWLDTAWGIKRTPGAKKQRWSERDIQILAEVLRGLPERDLLFTPRLRNIERVSTLGGGAITRYDKEDGRIKISDRAIGLKDLSEAYDGQESLAVALTLSIGHALQVGDGTVGVEKGADGHHLVARGLARRNFDEFIALSGWEVIEPQRWRENLRGDKVILDGKEVSCGEPIEHGETKIVLIRFGSDLFKIEADAQFGSKWRAKENPWADFAETFAEYVLLPHRLLKNAPEKFRYMDQEFRKYEGKAEIHEALYPATASSTMCLGNPTARKKSR